MADSTTENNQRPQQGFSALSQHVSTHKLEMGLWATRLMTIVFTFAYFLPIFPAWLAGANPVAAYHKVSKYTLVFLRATAKHKLNIFRGDALKLDIEL